VLPYSQRSLNCVLDDNVYHEIQRSEGVAVRVVAVLIIGLVKIAIRVLLVT